MIVRISKKAEKQLKRVPKHIRDNLDAWKIYVEAFGIRDARKIPGWKDHPLKGEKKKAGIRAIYLNDKWRAEYVEETGEIIEVREVSNHYGD